MFDDGATRRVKIPNEKQRAIKRENLRVVDETEEVAGDNEIQAAVNSLDPLLLRTAASGDLESLSGGDLDDDGNEEQPVSSSSSSSSSSAAAAAAAPAAPAAQMDKRRPAFSPTYVHREGAVVKRRSKHNAIKMAQQKFLAKKMSSARLKRVQEAYRQADKKADVLASSDATGSPSSSSSSSSSSSLSSSSYSPAPDVDDGGVPSVALQIGQNYTFSFFDDAVE